MCNRKIVCENIFRNSINNGLLLIENDKLHDDVKEGDSVTVTVNEDIDYNEINIL